jgi:hypothetical protein
MVCLLASLKRFSPYIQCTSVGSEVRGAVKAGTAVIITAAYHLMPPTGIFEPEKQLKYTASRVKVLRDKQKFIYASKWKDVSYSPCLLYFTNILLASRWCLEG